MAPPTVALTLGRCRARLDLGDVRFAGTTSDRARERGGHHRGRERHRPRRCRGVDRRGDERGAGRHRCAEAARRRGPPERERRIGRDDDLQHHGGARGQRPRRVRARAVRCRSRDVQQRRHRWFRRSVDRPDGTVAPCRRRQPVRGGARDPSVPSDHAAAGGRPHRQHRIDGRARRGARPGAVLRDQARSRRSQRSACSSNSRRSALRSA